MYEGEINLSKTIENGIGAKIMISKKFWYVFILHKFVKSALFSTFSIISSSSYIIIVIEFAAREFHCQFICECHFTVDIDMLRIWKKYMLIYNETETQSRMLLWMSLRAVGIAIARIENEMEFYFYSTNSQIEEFCVCLYKYLTLYTRRISIGISFPNNSQPSLTCPTFFNSTPQLIFIHQKILFSDVYERVWIKFTFSSN